MLLRHIQHPHSYTKATLRPNASILLFAFFKIHNVICKLNCLFSSFIYLPSFIIWLLSFTSPWFVQLASKYAWWFSVLFIFWIFFHSVKKVCRPSLFCEIICVSKRTLVILIGILYYTAFFKAKNFVILFLLSFVWFIDLLVGRGFHLGKFS